MSGGAGTRTGREGIALFDLDYTLLGGDATWEWMQFLMRRGIVDPASFGPRLERYYEQYSVGTLDIGRILAGETVIITRELLCWHGVL